MSGSLAGRTATKEFEKGRTELTKVRRYWAGKAPEWVQETEEDVPLPPDVAPEDDATRRATFVEPVVVRPAADSRLARLQQYKSIDREEAYARHREVAAPEVVKRSRDDDGDGDDSRAARRARRHPQEEEEEAAAASSSSEEDEDESGDERDEDGEDPDEAEARRQRLRQALLERQQQQEREEAEQKRQAAEEAAHLRQESDEDEYETDSEEEDEDEDDEKLLKPVFVPKNQRDTVLEREQMEQEEEELQKREAERKLERKEETRQLVGEMVKLEQEAKKGLADTPALLEDIDTDDEGGDEDTDFEAWRQRELARVRRERSARERLDREASERERLKTMTAAERAEWERLHPKVPAAKAPKSKWKFLQKYWHRGAYFQNEADDDRATVGGDTIFKRDYSGATGEDKFDKSMLPAVMQVRNFGRSGRTKWKHLVAEDTTNWEDPWVNDSKLRSKYTQKMAGMAQDFNKPKSHRT